jgi:site-specific DNA recombinase
MSTRNPEQFIDQPAHRYFIYVRKSTDREERQARSIGDQLAEIRQLVKEEKLDVVGSFEESQSAMTKGRPQFNEMLRRIEAGEADGIIAWHPDRLARNAFDGGRVIDLLDERKIRDLKFCSFWFESTAQGKLMLNLAFGQSKYYSDSLSVNIRRGQRQKLSEGVWAWKAPVGYVNEPKLRTIVIDPVMAPLVKMCFELYASGQYTLDRLRDTMHAKGLRGHRANLMSLSRFQYLLKNPFYYGVLNLNGELHQGSHQPLVTKDLFDSVQAMMQRRSKPTPIRLKSYVYRGLFCCGECGCTITMETQKGHNYLRCTKRVTKNCSQPYLREEKVTEQIAAALKSVSLPDEAADALLQRIEAERDQSDKPRRAAKESADQEIKKIDSKLDRLTAAYLDAGAFSAEDFRRRKAELLGAKRKLLDKVAALDEESNLRFEPVIRFVNGSKQMKYVAERAESNELRAKLEKVGSNLTIRDRTLTWTPRGAWELLVNAERFAQRNTAPLSGAAVSLVNPSSFPGQWSHGESNPDLLNAIQVPPNTNSSSYQDLQPIQGQSAAQCAAPSIAGETLPASAPSAGELNGAIETPLPPEDLRVVMSFWEHLSASVRAGIVAMVQATRRES